MTRINSMDATDQDYTRWEWDPFLPTNWRYQDAYRLARGDDGKWSSDDPAIVECAAYLKAIADVHDKQKQADVRDRWSALVEAQEIAQQDNPRRWELESRVLANQPVREIAAQCGLLPDVILAYEALFFDVRVRLGAGMWITSTVIGDGIQRGFLNHEVGLVWAVCGYHGGPIIVDALIDTFHAARRPGRSRRPTTGPTRFRFARSTSAVMVPTFGSAKR
jgi:hypothetical protein